MLVQYFNDAAVHFVIKWLRYIKTIAYSDELARN